MMENASSNGLANTTKRVVYHESVCSLSNWVVKLIVARCCEADLSACMRDAREGR